MTDDGRPTRAAVAYLDERRSASFGDTRSLRPMLGEHPPCMPSATTCSTPPPVAQQPYPPLIIGGESGAALTRAFTLGNGWYSRLVLLPQPDAERADRHRPVPRPQILANLDSVAEQLIHA
jgi:alkanesulfonate monooxygenase SsuD/methylene tetrahydromethanopterin reductase-like flavin-dependent oxidoreductase (luciferase family)